MTIEQKNLFEKLSNDRRNIAKALNAPSVSGFKKSVVDKYSDQAHFIYELLQNADDVGATSVSFELEEERLICKHNGTRHFTVCDVADEGDPSKLGDLNAITSIGNSSKTTEQKIGKFGVGFKAVFQYTDNPIIYDPIFKFRINELIVPVQIENDFPGRNENETVFEFPFNLPNKPKEECYEEISYKLRHLDYPVLFLRNLRNVRFTDKNGSGFYAKEIDEEIKFDNTTAQKLRINNYDNGKEKVERLWLFTRLNEQKLTYSVGFFLDTKKIQKKNKKTGEEITTLQDVLRSKEVPAFCYFSTQMTTNLGFIIHAPFLLNDSREGIKSGEKHNHEQIENLSNLAADSFEYLKQINSDFINKDIFSLIPYKRDELYGDNKNKLSLVPFYDNILEKFSTEELLPTEKGFTKAEFSYIAYNKNLTKLFSNEILGELFNVKKAQWAFPFLSLDSLEDDNEDLYDYLGNLTRRAHLYNFDEEQYEIEYEDNYYDNNFVKYNEIFSKISSDFIEKQSIEWLAKFYGHIVEVKAYSDWLKDVPIFLDSEGKAAAAFDRENLQSLFLPSKKVTGYRTINSELLSKQQTKKLIELYGLREPSFKDEIYQVILPELHGEINNYDDKFKKIFAYYLECNREESSELIEKLNENNWILSVNSDTDLYAAKNLYMKNETLEKLFSGIKNINFIDFEYYKNLISNDDKEELADFFKKLGVKQNLQFIESKLDYSDVVYEEKYKEYKGLSVPYSTEGHRFTEKNIEYLGEILTSIKKNNDKEKSVLLWKELVKLVSSNNTNSWKELTYTECFNLECHYKYYSYYTKSYAGRGEIWLKNKDWLFNKEGEIKKSDNLFIEDLSSEYDTTSKYGKLLVTFLSLKQNPDTEFLNSLPEEERKDYLKLKKFKDAGYSDDEIEEALAYLNAKRNNKIQYEGSNYQGRAEGSENYGSSSSFGGSTNRTNLPEDSKTNKEDESNDVKMPVFSDIKKAIRKHLSEKSTQKENRLDISESDYSQRDDIEDFDDSDDYSPKPIDFQKKIDRAKNKTINEIMQFEREQQLQNIVNNSTKYSYEWFKALLELEINNSRDSYSQSREVSICFTKVEREVGTEHTLILKQPNKAIPQYMEELTDITLKLFINGETKNLTIDAINVHSYNLKAKLKANTDLDKIDFSQVQEAHIEAVSPVFLLDELRKSFEQLNFDSKKNLKDDLCSNIEFIFGPPGTGKTTHIAKDILIPIMKKTNKKILVLTPTNKAADVLVKKVMDFDDNPEWLVRFGVTGDEEIESSPVYKEREYDIKKANKSVVVTTIARFPYDYFIAGNNRYELKELKWDYIIIDEASMIPLVNIIYPLYKKQPEKFIISGDPFQIEPITAVELWKNENIYTLVELNSFTNPTTKPHTYPVELLSTQYRSIPVIGQIYGQLCYGNVLKHSRTKNSGKSFNMKDQMQFNKINVIYFPVSEYESIYKAKSLNHKSPYQIYLAIFIYEFVKYISDNILISDGEKRTLGIIAPYRAQADLIQKLCERESFNKNLDVQVSTIHGFQGDECDIVIDVFNTPEHISGGKGVFLNKKNIINVAVSRARDYLFVVMPDKQTNGKENLTLINRLEKLCQGCGASTYTSKKLEEIMFKNPSYIEENTFSTSHQSVNVYGIPEKKYEVRTEDSAVDIQVHKKIAVIKIKKHETEN